MTLHLIVEIAVFLIFVGALIIVGSWFIDEDR